MVQFALKFPDYPSFGSDLAVTLGHQVTLAGNNNAWLVRCSPAWPDARPWLKEGEPSRAKELRLAWAIGDHEKSWMNTIHDWNLFEIGADIETGRL